ncbi:MAG: hypothetical protein C0462_01980 [Alcanivorax sp.]|nr:hypothetical protein [Alcanivorax sp.]
MDDKKQLTDIWNGKKMDYWLTDERGEKTSLRMEKWAADILHKELQDVQSWLQDIYSRVAEKYPELSRRAKGNHVRHAAETEARKSRLYVSVTDFL